MSQLNFEINEQAFQEFLAVANQIAEAETDDFFELAKLTGRDPKTDFAGADLRGVDFSLKNRNARALARARARVLARAIKEDVALTLDVDVALDLALDVALDLALARVRALALDLALARTRVRARTRTRFRALGRARPLDRTRARSLEGYLDGAHEIISILACDLSNANLSNADLSNADLSNANLSNANLTGADLSNVNLNGANVADARFELTSGLSDAEKHDLMQRGAIFEEAPGDRSPISSLVPSRR